MGAHGDAHGDAQLLRDRDRDRDVPGRYLGELARVTIVEVRERDPLGYGNGELAPHRLVQVEDGPVGHELRKPIDEPYVRGQDRLPRLDRP